MCKILIRRMILTKSAVRLLTVPFERRNIHLWRSSEIYQLELVEFYTMIKIVVNNILQS